MSGLCLFISAPEGTRDLWVIAMTGETFVSVFGQTW